jgi:DNA-binding XRE family transcriptional regulator
MKKHEETFGYRVSQICQHLMMKQKDFAKSIHISEASMSEIVKNKYKPGHDFFYNIAKTYKVNLNFLLFGKGDMFLESLSLGGGLSSHFSSNPEIKNFLWYLERSPILQHFILGHYRRYMNEERKNIERDVKIFIDEVEGDFDSKAESGKKKK